MAIAALTACGGGGSGGSSTPATVTNSVLQGVWSGTSSSGASLSIVSLENGDTYSMFGTVSSGVLSVVGFDEGNLTVSGSTVSGTLTEYLNNGTSYSGALNGTVSTNTSISGTTTWSGGTTTFSATPTSSTNYVYNTPAVISDVVGSWTGSMLNGTAATITVASNGAVTGSNSGCTFTGTVTPRASGKNVFDVSITFGAAPCALPGQTATGIALDYLLSTGFKQLLVAVQSSNKAAGTMFFAQR